MNQEPSKKASAVAWVSAAAIIIAAIIGLGMPFAENIAARYLPPFTPTPNSNLPTEVVSQSQTPNNPPISPTSTYQFIQSNFPNITISANANNGVQFIAPTSGNYKFTIQEGVYCTPSVCRSIVRGYLGRDIVWKDWYGLPHPMDQDYEIGCWEKETASNRNCAVGMFVVISMNAQQYIRWVIMEDKNSFADNNGAVVFAVVKLP